MKLDVRFKSIDYSDALVDYAEERLGKITKFEIKPVNVHITFSQVRHICQAEVYAKGMNSPFRAKAQADSFHEALDKLIPKLMRQMEKEKSITKHHKNYERSDMGRLERLIREEQELKKVA